MSYIDNLYWGYKTPDADFAHTKREIDRVLNSNWIASIKREMEQYKNLLNEKEFKLYIEKFFDILMRYLNPVTPDVPATRLAPAYTRRYGRGGAERKSKRKTRKNRK
jgi:hypothetical protein